MAEIGSAFVTIAPSAKGFGTKLNSQVGAGVKSSGSSLGKTFGKMFAAGAGIIAAIGIKDFLSGSIDEAREAQKVGAQTGAVLKSTGKIANVSAGQVSELASALSAKIGVDDEAIQAGENMLLTFTKVRNEVGAGNDIFNQATITVQDMAAAFGGDAVSNSKILGKALNDPIKGVSALTRVGVSFTDAQKEQIKTLVESGDTLGAQKVILKELAKQSAGSAEAQVTNADKARVAYDNLKEQVGTALLPVLDNLAKFVTTDIIPAVSKFVIGMQEGTGAGGEFRDAIEQIVSTGKGVVSFLNGLPGPVKQFGAEAAIAAAVVPKLSGAMAGMGLPSFNSNLATGASKMERFGAAAKMAGGVAGMALLADSTQQTNKAMGVLEGAAGGALAGFAVGGPLGAGLGALAGAELALVTSTDQVKESFKFASPKAADFADQLNKVSGAATRAANNTTALALQQSGALDAGRELGLSTRDLVKYVLGNESAIKRVDKAITSASGEQITWTDAMGRTRTVLAGNSEAAILLNTALGRNSKAAQVAKDKTQQLAIAGGELQQALKGVQDRSKIVAAIETKGYPETKGQLAKLIADYDLARKDVKTLIKATGVDATVGQVQRVLDRMALVKDKTVTITVRTNRLGGGSVTSSSGGHSVADPTDPKPKQTATRFGRLVGDGLAKGIGDSDGKVGQAVDKLTKKVKERLSRLRDNLATAKSDFAGLVEPITANFTSGLFDFDTASAFSTNLTAVRGTLTTLLGNFKTLVGNGLSPGFLYKLFQEGGPALIAGLAALPKEDAQAAGALFGQVTSLADELGGQVTGATDRGLNLIAEQKKTNTLLEKLLDEAKKNPDKVADANAQPHKRARRRAVRAA